MRILVFNAGSSSLKFALCDTDANTDRTALPLLRGTFDRFGADGCDLALTGGAAPARSRAPHTDIAGAIAAVPALLGPMNSPENR